MVTEVLRVESVAGLPGLPAPADVADTWLAHALERLLACYGLSDDERRRLVETGACPPGVRPPRPIDLDASRLAIEFTALAVEARLNRVLQTSDPDHWSAVAQLSVVHKYHLAPHLFGHADHSPLHTAFRDEIVELFALRDELVDAGPVTTDALATTAFAPEVALRMVEAGASVCALLSTLAATERSDVAEHVRRAAHALAHPAAHTDTEAWQEFPPDVVGS